MVGERKVFLHFVEPRRRQLRERVLLPIHHPLAERRKHLAEAHRGGVRAEGLEETNALGVLGGAEADALKVGGGHYRADVVRDHPESVFPKREQRQAVILLEGRFETRADRAGRDSLEVVPVGNEEREIEDPEFGSDRVHDRGRNVHLEGAQAEPLEHFLVLAELAGAEDADLDLAREAGLDQLLEMPRPVVEGRAGKTDVAQPDYPGPAGVVSGPASRCAGGESRGEERQKLAGHPGSGKSGARAAAIGRRSAGHRLRLVSDAGTCEIRVANRSSRFPP